MTAPAEAASPAPPGAIVKVRLAGTRRGCAGVDRHVPAVFRVVSISEPYPEAGSSRLVQVYVRVRLDLRPEPPPAAAAEDGRP